MGSRPGREHHIGEHAEGPAAKFVEPESGQIAASTPRKHVPDGIRSLNATITGRNRMPAESGRRKSSSRSGGSSSGAKKSGGKRVASKKSGATKTLKKTAVKVMAGAAAGAVRAIIPPLEEAAGTSERAAGIKPGSPGRDAKSARKPGK
jgi:hypothetical protein